MKKEHPPENLPFKGQMTLLDQTMDAAEQHLQEKNFSEAATELTSIWDYRLAGAQGMIKSRFDELVLMGRTERHAKLMKRLHRKGGLIRRLIRKLM